MSITTVTVNENSELLPASVKVGFESYNFNNHRSISSPVIAAAIKGTVPALINDKIPEEPAKTLSPSRSGGSTHSRIVRPPPTREIEAPTKRLLTSSHVSWIALGGIIGTGLFMGVRNTLTNGPIISLCSYAYISVISWSVIQSISEMACFMPVNGSVCHFQFKFLSESMGVSINVIYWLSWSITLALELSLIYSILSYWELPWIRSHPLLVIFTAWFALTAFNLLPVNYYGEIELIVSVMKVIFLVSWIFVSSYLIMSQNIGFTHWNKDLIWGIDTVKVIKNPAASKFMNIAASLTSSCFTFQSIESIAICSGEIKDVHKNLPKAVKYVFFRIAVFYILTLFLLTLMIPANDPKLISAEGDDDIFSSPFLISLINMGLNSSSLILGTFNFVILISIISAANSNIYFGSRCLISIVESGYLPKMLIKTDKRGVPYNAVLATASFGLISMLLKFKSVEALFSLLINVCATSGLLMWLLISASYIRFREILKFNELTYELLSFRSKFPKSLLALNYFTIINITHILILNGATNFWSFNWDLFVSCYLSVAVLVSLTLFLKVHWNKPFLVPIGEIDIFTGSSPYAYDYAEEANSTS